MARLLERFFPTNNQGAETWSSSVQLSEAEKEELWPWAVAQTIQVPKPWQLTSRGRDLEPEFIAKIQAHYDQEVEKINIHRDERYDQVKRRVESLRRIVQRVQKEQEVAYQIFTHPDQFSAEFLLHEVKPEQVAYQLSGDNHVHLPPSRSTQLKQLREQSRTWSQVWGYKPPEEGEYTTEVITNGKRMLEAKGIPFSIDEYLNFIFSPQYEHRPEQRMYVLTGFKVQPQVIDRMGELELRREFQKMDEYRLNTVREALQKPQSFVDHFRSLPEGQLHASTTQVLRNNHSRLFVTLFEIWKITEEFRKKYELLLPMSSGKEKPQRIQLVEKNPTRVEFIFSFSPEDDFYFVSVSPTQELIQSIKRERQTV